MSEENKEFKHAPRGFSKLSAHLIRQMQDSNLGIQGARNLTESEQFVDNPDNLETMKKQQNVVVVRATEKKTNGKVTSVEITPIEGEIDADRIIDSFKGTRTFQRTPRILAFPVNVSPETVEKVMKKAQTLVQQTNKDKSRFDTISVLNVPIQEYQRLAVKGEVEKQISDRIEAKEVSGEKIADKIPEYVQSCKADPNSYFCGLLTPLVQNINVKNPLFNRKSIRNQLKDDTGKKYLVGEALLNRLAGLGINMKRLVDDLNARYHPDKSKEYTLDSIRNWTSRTNTSIANRIASVALDQLEEVKITNLKIDSKNKDDGIDNGNIFITGEFTVGGDTYKIERPILFNDGDFPDVINWENLDKKRKGGVLPKRILRAIEDNNRILSLISNREPNTPDNMFTTLSGKHGVTKDGEGKTRIAPALISPPEIPDGLDNILDLLDKPEFKDSLGKINPTEFKKKFIDWRKKDFEFRRQSIVAETHRCPSGSVEVTRLATRSKGMTPPQQKCTVKLLEGRETEYNDAKSKVESGVDPEALENLFSGNFGKIVGCYEHSELDNITKSEEKRKELEDIRGDIFNGNTEDEKLGRLSKEVGIAENDIKHIADIKKLIELRQDVFKLQLHELSVKVKNEPNNIKLQKQYTDTVNKLNKQGTSLGLGDDLGNRIANEEDVIGGVVNKYNKLNTSISNIIAKKNVYKVPRRFPVRTTGSDSYCKSITNAVPNVHYNPETESIETEEAETSGKKKPDVRIISKKRKKTAMFIKKEESQ